MIGKRSLPPIVLFPPQARVAQTVRLSLRARNEMLEQAGFARAFCETGLEGASLAPVRGALQHMLRSHAQYPAIICDRHWTIVDANASAAPILAPSIGETAELTSCASC